MPPQIKQDLNRSGWETTDFPSVCETCLGGENNAFMQMIKEDYGAECKICSRPFTLFRWKTDRTSRQKKTQICLTCARLKNACQHCMLDLSFGLPLAVRDAALKMANQGPTSNVNKQWFAQEHEKEIEEGRGDAIEAHGKTDEKARDLLRRLANSEPFYKKQRRLELEAEQGDEGVQKLLPPAGNGPVRPRDSKLAGAVAARGSARGGHGGGRGGGGLRGSIAIKPEDILPPPDRNITSLFVTGVEDDLPEHELRTFFSKYGTLRSLICSHRSHCAFVNYATRQGAETAAEACQGKAVVKGVPLRVQWGKPKPLDTMDREQRIENAKAGRAISGRPQGLLQGGSSKRAIEAPPEDDLGALVPTAPPGQEDVEYASLAGN